MGIDYAGNTAKTRSEWCEHSINTNYISTSLDTGVTREYYLELTDGMFAPDGVERYSMAINGSIPGPTLFADWGDTVVVHVTNSLTSSKNGTSIHFHGIRQNYTNQNDGVSSITQCPTPPGSSITYKWKAEQYGTTWYHSHFGLQAWAGAFGGIVINGPSAANYDEDLGVLFLNDWSHIPVDTLHTIEQTGASFELDNGLLNGTNVYSGGDVVGQTGQRLNLSFTAGTSYRIRLINAAIDTHFKFSIDNHTLQVIANDLVPIHPYTTNILDIAMGQRYDVIVRADQDDAPNSSFWIRAIPQETCSNNAAPDNIKGVIHYGESQSTPTSQPYNYTDSCEDEAATNLKPYFAQDVGASTWNKTQSLYGWFNDEGLFRWYLNSSTMVVDWENPTLLQTYNNNTNFLTSKNLIELPEANKWAYIVIQSLMDGPHPIHLHGHDFLVLGQGYGTFNNNITLNLHNPPRRDTAMLLSSGYLVIAFETDNPGAWLMHCHVGWHTSEGFALQFLERAQDLAPLIDAERLESNCAAWNDYQTANAVVQDDSGV
ncbi:multicopper oxidase [Truncatella angustata]|uniref:laccase n=1 Tax=Truncatella angustata TaxID=152316 RepID=A0A9P8UHP1_9PEZI|nr:multicopper oxidase [Truncatella angustata]KAH6652279.1 multicopper oxidase [Truncatella angustata]